ncbi:MAG: hypothetical protein AB7F86_01805 [Bdellovibrionales bacterium]
MKKLIVLASLLTGFSVYARGGGGGGAGLPLNSQAYLIHEAVETSQRLLVLSMANAAASMTGVTADVIDAQGTTRVEIRYGGGVAIYTCTPFDDFSHGGTIVKKEMVCRAN